MKNFQLISTDACVVPLYNAVMRAPDLWNAHKVRTTHPGSPHHQVEDILLRFNEISQSVDKIVDDKECLNYPAMFELPQARPLIYGLMSHIEGERLGRCMITKLAPGKTITAHADEGAPAEYYDRYHIVLNSTPGSVFRCGDEKICMATGDIWWFNNRIKHEVINNGTDDRVHLIIDIRTFR